MADSVDIDLYENIEEGFDQEGEFNNENDLYDDVITASSSTEPADKPEPAAETPKTPVQTSVASNYTGRKWSVYVGNLTWWTTDQDLTDTLSSIGVSDTIEIKFHENRANGQSKGFAVVVVASENSSRNIFDKLPKKEVHGQTPVVTHCNKQALSNFEAQARKGEPPPANQQQQQNGRRDSRGAGGDMPPMNMPPRGPPPQQTPPRMRNFAPPARLPQRPGMPPMGQGPPPPVGMHGPPPGAPGGPPPHTGPPPQFLAGSRGLTTMLNMRGPPRPVGPMPPGIAPGMPPTSGPPPRMTGPPPGMPPRGPPMAVRGPSPMDSRAPPPMDNRPPAAYPNPGGPPPGSQAVVPPGIRGPVQAPTYTPGLPPTAQPPPGLPPPGLPGHPGAPTPHVNPAFFPTQHTQPPPVGIPPPHSSASDPYNRPPPVVSYPSDPYGSRQSSQPDRYEAKTRHEPTPPALTEAEFEEIFQRNKTVSSSAISRAVQDASAGDFASAIETLVTAISLIKQSKIASDDRCKILISSLQDTLHGIEEKSYGSKSSSSSRGRSRSRERDREREREKRSRSHRSRSRDREYRERSREREREGSSRHYDERHRDRGERRESDRDRDREREREYSSRSSRH